MATIGKQSHLSDGDTSNNVVLGNLLDLDGDISVALVLHVVLLGKLVLVLLLLLHVVGLGGGGAHIHSSARFLLRGFFSAVHLTLRPPEVWVA